MRDLKYRKTAKDRLTKNRHEGNVLRIKMHIRKGDTVRVMRGEDAGKEGKVLRVFLKTNRVLVEGINIVKRHVRARSAEETGGIIQKEAPVAASNVMLLDSKTGAPTRVRIRVDADGTKERISAKSGDAIARPSR